jgi:hypothetical protein
VQAAHASIDASRLFLSAEQSHPHLVVCAVSGERDLLAAADRLERAGIRFTIFREPDRNDEATAIATEPLCGERRRALARYPCLTRADLLSTSDGKPAGTLLEGKQ